MRNFYTKSLLTVLLSLYCAVVSAQSFESNGISYSILSLSDRTVEVAHNANYQGFIIIPSTADYSGISFKVTGIGDEAFSGTNVTEMIISEGVTHIGDSAFYASTLKEIIIPNSVISIASRAFERCTVLKSITIPNNVTSIGDYAFSYCYGLTSVTIGNSVTTIGDYAFYECTYLTGITVNSGNSVYDSREGCNAIIETATNTLVTGCKNTIIPNSVTSIGDKAFYSCDGLTSVTIPNSVTSIGDKAFCYCDGLTSVTIGNSVTSIGDYAFYYCDGLTSITIPNSVTSIGDDAFCYCDGLTSVTIGNSVTSIGNFAFSSCSGLTSVTIPNSVTSIGDYAFSYCYGLTSVTIPNSVTSIGGNAFWDCIGLTSITIPNSVTSIGNEAFSNTAWYNNQPYGVVYAGEVLYNYKGTMPANTSITIKEGTLGIASDAFSSCKGLTSIIIPNSVTSIGNGAFQHCSGLTSVTIPNSVTWIGDYAFWGCTGLTSVTIPNSVTSIGYGAFQHCSGLASVTIPNSVTWIGDYAFCGCTGLTSVTIPNSVTSIGKYAFQNCSGLAELYVKATEPPTIYSNTFNKYTATLHVPTGSKTAYQAADYWKDFFNIVEMTITGDVDGDKIVDIADVTTLAEIILNGEETDDGPTEQTFDAWTSTNTAHSSTSQNSYTMEATEGSVLTFDWSVSSETNYDWLIVTLDGTQILKKSGNYSGSYTHTFTTAGTHTLVVKYTKDGSSSSGSDKGKIYNIKLSGSANNKTNPAADVDGDGSIDVADVTSLVNIILGTTEE